MTTLPNGSETCLIENQLRGILDLVVLRQEADVLGDDLFGLLLGQVLRPARCVVRRKPLAISTAHPTVSLGLFANGSSSGTYVRISSMSATSACSSAMLRARSRVGLAEDEDASATRCCC